MSETPILIGIVAAFAMIVGGAAFIRQIERGHERFLALCTETAHNNLECEALWQGYQKEPHP